MSLQNKIQRNEEIRLNVIRQGVEHKPFHSLNDYLNVVLNF